MSNCLSARTIRYRKDETILRSGNTMRFIGLVLSGSVNIIEYDYNGNTAIIARFTVPELFGEAFVCAGISHSPVTIQAAEDTEILSLDYQKVIKTCTSACPFHAKLVENMMKQIAQKNLFLVQKISILSKRSTREKLLHFFETQRGGSNQFTIPLNREELANYLCVDRSAMSNELCKMRDEGLIKFQKNKFEIIKQM